MSGKAKIRDWFDRLERELHVAAERAGLLGHGTMIGDARSFFVNRALASVLPPFLHIGSGKVISAAGAESKQQDVIIYDPRFPVFEIEHGKGLYPAEGTIATIEVKSSLNSAELETALENCLSVALLKHSWDWPSMLPCTYIFAFKTDTEVLDTFSGRVLKWWNDHQFGYSDANKLPQILVAGSFVGLTRGTVYKPDNDPPLPEGTRRILAIYKTPRQFGWLLMHLLTTVAFRFEPSKKFFCDAYLPHGIYFAEDLDGQPAGLIDEALPPSPPAAPAQPGGDQ